ncbi:MAG: twin-arginine translocase TatA/TatE family subunit [Candidatus Hydrogenedentes bacterium]|jgi:sec-independent protein translocase protein TatA|nr:twin-arginine translocase TatA/TatE family subunit [Candidatus Hydrogenedentota bacterium]
MWTPGIGELVIIFLIVLVLFGGGKLSGVGKSLGTAISEFKSAINEDKKEEPEKTTEDAPEA